MSNDYNKVQLTDSVELHRIAEERLRTHDPEATLPDTQEETEQLVHDLEVRQIELEIQNTELRDARYEVEMDLEKYTDLYEFAPVSYFTLDRSGSIIALNLTAANLMRIERSLLPGRCFCQFLAVEYRPAFSAFLETVFTNRVDETCEAVLLDNVSLPLTVQIGAAISASGDECRLSLIDITEQRQTRKLLEHEQGSHTDATVEIPKIELELGVCSIREALDASMEMLREKARESGVVIHLDLAPEIDQRIVADLEMLKQIMFSLLCNAVRFSPPGGTVDVRAIRDGNALILTIDDTGTGIRVEEIPNLFEPCPLPESESSKENEVSPSGLGLPMTRQLVELHGGVIQVESEFGTGSRFSVSLPLRNCQGIT
jgi:signal transduction histidine kinase